MRPGGILSLDLSKHVGWVYGHPADNAVPLWGVKDLPQLGGYGYVFNALQNTLEDLLDEHQPSLVGIEDIISQRNNSAYVARLTSGIHAIADLVCYQSEILTKRVGVDHVRSAVIGRCRLTALERAARPKLTVKTALVAPWIEAHGWSAIEAPDAMDAAVVFAYLAGIRRINI